MKAAIIGASGYTGAELMRILHGHPEVEVSYASAHKYAGEKVTSLYPHLHGYAGMEFQAFDAEAALARELELQYAIVSPIVNWAAGIGAGGIDVPGMAEILEEPMRYIRTAIADLV